MEEENAQNDCNENMETQGSKETNENNISDINEKEKDISYKTVPTDNSNTNNNDDEEFEEEDNRSRFQKLFGKMRPGSLRGSIFNLCILSIGTGSLALPQKFQYLTLFFAPVFIIITGIANLMSLFGLSAIGKQYKIKKYDQLVSLLCGKKASVFLDIIMIINVGGILILYQVIMYKLLGGIINDVGGMGYSGIDDFIKKSFWGKLWVKFAVIYGIAIIFLMPLYLLKDFSKLRYSSTLGIISLFFLIIIIIGQCPFFIIDNKEKGKEILNYYDLSYGFSDDMHFLRSIATLFYAYSCQVGVFPVIESMHRPTKKRVKKLLISSTIIDILCYLIIGYAGYLTQPIDTPDLIIERNTIFEYDWIMNIGQGLFIITLICKMAGNYNCLRVIILSMLGYDSKLFPGKVNFIITIITIIITSFISAIFQSISDYISLIGSFCSIIICFVFPGIIYIKGKKLGITNCKNIFIIICVIILSIFGLTSGVYTLIGIIKNTEIKVIKNK